MMKTAGDIAPLAKRKSENVNLPNADSSLDL